MLADYAALVAKKRVWVAIANDEILGVLVLIPDDAYLLIDNIAVHPDAQGKGIGSRLLIFADQEALRRDHSELSLYTHVQMIENIALYRHLGWEETGRGLQDGYERVFFRRSLS
jgi:GNAT superfamily N-acetyltransferase